LEGDVVGSLLVSTGSGFLGSGLGAEDRPWRPSTVIGLQVPRDELTSRLDTRAAAMFANGLRHFTHCCAAGPKPHVLHSCAGVSANGPPHAMHWDAFGPKPQVAQRWAVVDMGARYRGRAPECLEACDYPHAWREFAFRDGPPAAIRGRAAASENSSDLSEGVRGHSCFPVKAGLRDVGRACVRGSTDGLDCQGITR
jgi:hypothetical protein